MLRHFIEEGAEEKEIMLEQYEIKENIKGYKENRTEGETNIMWHIFSKQELCIQRKRC
jgi:hypothetical protein